MFSSIRRFFSYLPLIFGYVSSNERTTVQSRLVWVIIAVSVIITLVMDMMVGIMEPAVFRWARSLIHTYTAYMVGLAVHSVIDRLYDLPDTSYRQLIEASATISPGSARIMAAHVLMSSPYLFAFGFALVVAMM